MNNQPLIQVEPIKEMVLPIGNIRGGAPSTEGNVRLKISAPSRRIHVSIQVGWTGNPSLLVATWSLFPVMVNKEGGAQVRLQPVKSTAALPDGYEAESGVKMWEADLHFITDDILDGQVFAVIIWEPSVVDMCEQERAYWAARCEASRLGAALDIGESL